MNLENTTFKKGGSSNILFAKMTFIIQEEEDFNNNTINEAFCTPPCLFTLQLNV